MPYLPTPDSQGNCCDCNRAAPCDTCTAEGACCYGPSCFNAYSQFDCESSGGQYMGDSSVCSGPCPTGACCFGDTNCFEGYNANGCQSAGGTYQGDGSVCHPNPCCSGSCPGPSLECDSVGASKSKCGFAFGPMGHQKIYLHHDFTENSTIIHSDGDTTCNGNYSEDYNPDDCSLTCSPGNFIINYTGGSLTEDCNCGSCSSCTGVYTTCIPGASPPTITDTSETDCHQCGDGSEGTEHGCTTNSYSNEYTTGQLISNTLAAIPAYFGHFGCEESAEIGFRIAGQGCICFAARHLSPDESSYTIARFRYRFKVKQPRCCYLKVRWNETFKPDLPNGSEDPDPSHWRISPNQWIVSGGTPPCDDTQDIFSQAYEVNEPGTNGTIYITDVTSDCSPP